MLVVLMIALLCAMLCAAVVLGSRGLRGGSASGQIADLQSRVDQLERSAVAVANELRRLEDSQRFTERLLTSRAASSTGEAISDSEGR